MKTRLFFTLVIIFAWCAILWFVNTSQPIVSGRASLAQLQNTDSGWYVANAGTHFGAINTVVSLLVLGVLALIWTGAAIKNSRTLLAAGFLCLFATSCGPGPIGGSGTNRNYDNLDYRDVDEYVQIRANQTAFLVDQVGDTKAGQGTFDSTEFLKAKEVSEKRIKIPHMQLHLAGVNNDRWIPSSVLYLVTREPFVRQWTKLETRGTSNKDEGIYVESAESLNVDFGVSIGAHIEIPDAAKYLFRMGTEAPDPNKQFPSEVNAKPLELVMDTKVHQRVQTLLFQEFGKRKLDDCLAQKQEIMDKVSAEVKEEFLNDGITIDYLGYATSLNLPPEIQRAIDLVYSSKKDADAAANQMAALPARKAMAEIQVIEAEAEAIKKWDGHLTLPNALFMSDQTAGALGNLLHPTPVAK